MFNYVHALGKEKYAFLENRQFITIKQIIFSQYISYKKIINYNLISIKYNNNNTT